MKKNIKVLQINGFRGLFLTLFIISCLIAGFVAFPAFLSMNVWNFLSLKTGSFPVINFYESLLLWGIIAFSGYLFSKRKFIVSFNAKQELTEDEVNEVMSRIKCINSKMKEELKSELSELSEIKEEETANKQ